MDVGRGLTEDSFNYADFHSCGVESSECTPVVDDETGPYHVGATIDCAGLKASQFRGRTATTDRNFLGRTTKGTCSKLLNSS